MNWRQFCFISDCGNSFNCKLKKLINEQIVRFYSPSNAICWSDESVQIKHFKHHAFIGMCSYFTWFNLKIMNFYFYLSASLKFISVIVKTRCFYGLPLIHNQNFKKFSTLFLRYTKKNSLQNLTRFHDGSLNWRS